MDDLMLNSSCSNKSNLLNLKGKDWSSLQNLESDDSEENTSELNFNHRNGYLNGTIVEYTNDKYTTNSSDDSLAHSDHRHSTKQHQHDTTKLNKEDMKIYGLRPAYDQFYLVVCEHCKKVFKPQALSKHIENRHSGNSELNHSSLINRLNIKQEENCSSSIEDEDHFANANNLRSILSSSSSSLLATNSKDDLERIRHHHPTTNKLKTSNSSSSNSTTASSSPLTLNDSNNLIHTTIKPRTTITKPKLLPCKDRKYDPDKHCGVRLNEDAQPCTRSLTCKTHSLTLRRAVQGRRDSFDKLLVEHRLAKEAALRAAGVEVKPTKLQLKQQQRLQKNNQLLKDNANNSVQNTSSFGNQSILNQSPVSNSSSINKSTINKTVQTPIQLKIHLQSPNHTLNSSPFKAFNQLHQTESNTATTVTTNLNNTTTAIQSPSFVNINNLQFTSPSPAIKQFTFGNNQQLTKLLSSPSRTVCNQQTNNIPLPSSVQMINQTNNLLNQNNHNSLSLTSQTTSKPFICDLNPATLNHYPKPAAVCTFNERRLSIYTQSSNKKILSSKLFNRKQDYAYSALSIFCNNEKSTILNDQNEQQKLSTPVKTKIKLNSSQSNSRSDSRDFSSSNSNNSQDSLLHQVYPFDQKRSFDRNGLFSIEQKR